MYIHVLCACRTTNCVDLYVYAKQETGEMQVLETLNPV